MFTGIIQAVGTVVSVSPTGKNLTVHIRSELSEHFRPDQSVSHDGVCLTVENVTNGIHQVTAVEETLKKTNLRFWKEGTLVNLEQSLRLQDRLDGHWVQGHADSTAVCTKKKEKRGSWEFTFRFPEKFAIYVIEKGSIALNGISLTCFNVKKNKFTVAIIPYTYDHTNLKYLNEGDEVNVEFDILGKYVIKFLENRKKLL
ncbi:MAG: riboflavin synthase [Chitinophagaceae bacterium]|nr:riboflavin synthase [Chitinophagaceae bacterium]